MHHDDWGNGWDGGYWWWIPMAIMMIVFWGGLIWLGVVLIRRPHGGPASSPPASPAPPTRPTAREILDERLARGEIDPEEYGQRVRALEKPGG